MDCKPAKGKWGIISTMFKGDVTTLSKSPILSCTNSPKQRIKALYRAASLDRSDSLGSRDFEEAEKRTERIRSGREERRQKYKLAEEKREIFRSQIRKKYGIKSKEESDSEKSQSKSSEGSLSFKSFLSSDFFKSFDKAEKKQSSITSSFRK